MTSNNCTFVGVYDLQLCQAVVNVANGCQQCQNLRYSDQYNYCRTHLMMSKQNIDFPFLKKNPGTDARPEPQYQELDVVLSNIIQNMVTMRNTAKTADQTHVVENLQKQLNDAGISQSALQNNLQQKEQELQAQIQIIRDLKQQLQDTSAQSAQQVTRLTNQLQTAQAEARTLLNAMHILRGIAS